MTFAVASFGDEVVPVEASVCEEASVRKRVRTCVLEDGHRVFCLVNGGLIWDICSVS